MLSQVALKLVPDSKTFIDVLKTKDENYDALKEKIQCLISLLGPFLDDIHCILVSLHEFILGEITSTLLRVICS